MTNILLFLLAIPNIAAVYFFTAVITGVCVCGLKRHELEAWCRKAPMMKILCWRLANSGQGHITLATT